MAAEQVGSHGRTALLRSSVGGRVLRTAHCSQTVYHGPVVYAEDPDRRLESASSDLALALLRVFMKPAVHRGQREYRFAVWVDGEPSRDRVDRKVSPTRCATRYRGGRRSPRTSASCRPASMSPRPSRRSTTAARRGFECS